MKKDGKLPSNSMTRTLQISGLSPKQDNDLSKYITSKNQIPTWIKLQQVRIRHSEDEVDPCKEIAVEE